MITPVFEHPQFFSWDATDDATVANSSPSSLT